VLLTFLVRCSGGVQYQNVAAATSNVHYVGRYASAIILIDGVQHELVIDTTKPATVAEPSLYHTEITLDKKSVYMELRKPIAAGQYYVFAKGRRLLFEVDARVQKEDENFYIYLRGGPGVLFAPN